MTMQEFALSACAELSSRSLELMLLICHQASLCDISSLLHTSSSPGGSKCCVYFVCLFSACLPLYSSYLPAQLVRSALKSRRKPAPSGSR